MTPQTGNEIDWPVLIGLALVGIVANLVYTMFFKVPWTPPEDARFVDENASLTISRSLSVNFSWGTVVWVTDQELVSSAFDPPVPLSSIKSIRMAKWYVRKEPVVVVECEFGSSTQTIQLAVQDWQKLSAVLASGSAKVVIQDEVEA